MKQSLRKKAIMLLAIMSLLLGGASVYAGARIIGYNMSNNYKERADQLAATIAATVDAEAVQRVIDQVANTYDSVQNRVGSEDWGSDAFNEYVSNFSYVESDRDFIGLRSWLRKIQDVNYIDCAYIGYCDFENEKFVYVVDAAEEDPCPPGCFDSVFADNMPILKDPAVGFPAYTTDTEEYGRLITAGVPIYKEGSQEIVGYAMVDISMDDVVAARRRQILMLAAMAALLSMIILAVSIRLLEKMVIIPINQMSDAAISYFDTEDDSSLIRTVFAGLDIRTGDEIEHLSESMKQMERDINDNMANIVMMSNELSAKKLEATKMNRLARTDALTHVRNKLVYDEEVRKLQKNFSEGETEFGIAVFDLNNLKGINDSYGHDKGNIYICANSQAICETFKHSPVFRIGGDEFAAILRGNDYDNIEERLEEFSEKNRADADNPKKDPWERVSTAAGYAVFEPGRDKDAEAVFKRADEAMYERKMEMKKK